ncbi:MAG: succinate dehydrogenase assembly factor 2 [Magnetococcus sp. XQGC-1]
MESSESLRKRLIFLAQRRSTAEMEGILGDLLAKRLPQWSDEECQRLITLLQYPDLDLLDWLSGVQEPPLAVDREVLGWLAAFTRWGKPV